MKKVLWFALILVALAVSSARAAEVPVKAVDYCSGCASATPSLGLNFEGDSESVTLHALGLQADNQGVFRGFGAFEVRSQESGARVRFDGAASVALVLQDAAGAEGCSGKAIAQLIVHGQDAVSGHFTLISDAVVVGAGLCPESRVSASLNLDADEAGIERVRTSWGSIKIR
jgi:hypothetical protein